MQWQDIGVILATKRFGESALKIDLLTAEHGLASGLVRWGASKKQKSLFDLGNIAALTWRGRLSEQLGQWTMELQRQPASLCMNRPLELHVISSMCGLLHQCLAEHHAEPKLYQRSADILQRMPATTTDELMSAYIWFEVELLAASGFPLDLERCVATGTSENLCYLSPKSGRAVCAEAGRPYRDKLFALPAFMLREGGCAAHAHEVMQGVQITSYFLDHIATDHLHAPLCEARTRLLEQYERESHKTQGMVGHNSKALAEC